MLEENRNIDLLIQNDQIEERQIELKSKMVSGRRTVILQRVLLCIVAVLVCCIILFPIIYMIPTAFKPKQEVWANPPKWHWLPVKFTVENFRTVLLTKLNKYNFLKSLLYTFLVACIAVVCSLFINMLAAFSFATVKFRGRSFLWWYFIITMFIPGITILLTSIRVVNILNMTDTLWVLIVPGLVSGYNIFFFRQFFLGIPMALEEAATIDGCSRIRMFFKIFLPMSVTPMIIIGISVFMGYWNAFLWPTLTILNNRDIAQVMQVIRILNSNYSSNYGIVIAATLMAIAVPITIFIIFQRKIIAGIAVTGLK